MHRAEAACGLGYFLVCLSVKPVGKPNAGDRHVRFDERGWETERWPQAPSYRAHPRLYRLCCKTLFWRVCKFFQGRWCVRSKTM